MEKSLRVDGFVPHPPDAVFAVATASLETFIHAVGPVPGVLGATILEGALAAGARRDVTMSDGSVTREEVTAFDAPTRHAYRWLAPPPFPLSLLVNSAHADWRFAPERDGTRIDWTYTFILSSPFSAPGVFLFGMLFRRWMQRALERLAVVVPRA